MNDKSRRGTVDCVDSSLDQSCVQSEIVWYLKDFGGICRNAAFGTGLSSPEFTVGSRSWCLTVYPGGSYEEYKDFISFYLVLEKGDVPVHAQLSLYFHNHKLNRTECMEPYAYVFKETNSSLGTAEFLLRSEALDMSKGWVDPDGMLTLGVVLTVYPLLMPEPSPSQQLHSGLSRLLDEKVFCDVSLVSKSGSKRQAHRVVLAAQSPVFAAMLQQPLQENLTRTIHLSELENDSIDLLLRYIYTETIPSQLSNEMVADLVILADKYQIWRLKHLCEIRLRDMITAETVLMFLSLADAHNLDALHQACISFIRAHTSAVVKSESFRSALPQCYPNASPKKEICPSIVHRFIHKINISSTTWSIILSSLLAALLLRPWLLRINK